MLRMRVFTSIDSCFFFFNDTATTEIYTLSLHDALPIWSGHTSEYHQVEVTRGWTHRSFPIGDASRVGEVRRHVDRKSTRLNSSHLVISYAVFCLKKKNRRNPPLLRSTPRARPHNTMPHP